MKKSVKVRPARTKGDLKIIRADGTVELVPKTQADRNARSTCSKINADRERRLIAGQP